MSVTYTPLEMLSRSGIIGFDADSYLKGNEGSTISVPRADYKVNGMDDYTYSKDSSSDKYNFSKNLIEKPSLFKKILASLLFLYITGVVVTRGKLNNIFSSDFYSKCREKVCKFIAKIFK